MRENKYEVWTVEDRNDVGHTFIKHAVVRDRNPNKIIATFNDHIDALRHAAELNSMSHLPTPRRPIKNKLLEWIEK